jgi:hypothetical protein
LPNEKENMQPPEFPPNSEASKAGPPRVNRVTSSDPVRKRKSLRKKFSETFVAGDMKSATQYVVFDILLTAARDMVVESVQGGIEKLFYGDTRKRGSTPPQAGPAGFFNYNRVSTGPVVSRMSSPQRAMSRMARSRHDFDEIVLTSRTEAELVIDQLYEVINRYGTASVADLYELVGINGSHTDQKWGWTDIRGAGVNRVRDGYLLDLPMPNAIN